MNKRRSHLSTAGAQILRKSPLSPVTPSNVPAHSPSHGPLSTAGLLRKCADQEGGRGVLPRRYSAGAQHRSSNPGALWGSGLLAATSNSETAEAGAHPRRLSHSSSSRLPAHDGKHPAETAGCPPPACGHSCLHEPRPSRRPRKAPRAPWAQEEPVSEGRAPLPFSGAAPRLSRCPSALREFSQGALV